ncbi:MAG: Spy/CpxP family protein refolding chaperone [Terracidiphilus sp.]|nr:Spy/CpxP family protein refolding chaperone [Terracidiphilus sp.]
MTRFSLIPPVLALTGIFAVAGAMLHAQDGPPPGPPPSDMQEGQQQGPGVDRQLKRLTKLLTLTEDQQAQVKVILTEEHQQMKALFDQSRAAQKSSQTDSSADAGGPPSPETMKAQREQMELIRDAANAKISALLTDTQNAKFTSWLDQQKKREARQGDDMPPPPPDGGGGPPPDGGGPGGGGPPPGF